VAPRQKRSETPGARIRRLRLERGLSQRQLAQPGVSYTYLSRIETDQRPASPTALRLLANKLGVLPEYLESGRTATATDELAERVFKTTDGALWITLTAAGVTLTWQEAGTTYQLDRPSDNLTQALLAAHDRVTELARLDAEQARLHARRAQLQREHQQTD
jgi:transcriptional regulator with XRE-family HTH domain